MKRTLILSVFAHVVIFSAALFLSADMLKGSRNVVEKIIFVKLSEDGGSSDRLSPVSKKEIIKPDKDWKVKEEKVLHDTQEKVSIAKADEVNDFIERKKPIEKFNNPDVRQLDSEDVHLVTSTDNNLLQSEEIANTVSMSGEIAGVSNDREDGLYTYSHPSFPDGKSDSGGEGNKVSPEEIIQLIGNAIERAKRYPMLARKRGMEGTTHVSFRITPEGMPHEIEIMKSSGFSILDKVTIDIIKSAAPYPYTESRVDVPVAYRLMD